MDQLIKQSFMTTDIAGVFNLWDVLISVCLSFVLCLVVAYIYKITHRGVSYSQSYVHTVIIMGVTVSVIMLIIGSNIARAFSLVGALSIIRFRNAVKETRDVGFIFFAMAVGMACGTRFYAMAVVSTILIGAMIFGLSRFNVAAKPNVEKILRVFIPENLDYQTAFDRLFHKYLSDYSLLSVETARQGMFLEAVYSVKLRRGASERELIDELRAINGNAKVSIIQGQENINV
jgi:uncharacterized membrane protein YhiD involved in acid resistance